MTLLHVVPRYCTMREHVNREHYAVFLKRRDPVTGSSDDNGKAYPWELPCSNRSPSRPQMSLKGSSYGACHASQNSSERKLVPRPCKTISRCASAIQRWKAQRPVPRHRTIQSAHLSRHVSFCMLLILVWGVGSGHEIFNGNNSLA